MAKTPTMASDKRKTNIRFSRAPGFRRVERPGTLSPDPWHLSLWADSMTRGASEIVPTMVRKRATFDPVHASRSAGDSLPVSFVCPLPPGVVAGNLNLLLWRIGLCRQAPRAPQQSGGMGGVAVVGRRLAFPSCHWHKAQNARGLGTESPGAGEAICAAGDPGLDAAAWGANTESMPIAADQERGTLHLEYRHDSSSHEM